MTLTLMEFCFAFIILFEIFFFQNEKIALHRPQNKYVKSNQRQIEFQLMTMMMTKMKHSHSNTQKKNAAKTLYSIDKIKQLRLGKIQRTK